jgi:serine/threonine protein phosphatase PrpC
MLYGTAQVNGRGRVPASTEDRFIIRRLMETGTCDLFAVFDGHAGAGVVNATVELLPKRIQRALEAAGPNILRQPSVIQQILRIVFIEHDKELASIINKVGDSGSTASIAIVTPTDIIMAYIGDSPAFLIDPVSGLLLSEIGKHEPTLATETARILKGGGTVEIDEYGTPRVDGNLMVSRAFGDFSMKWDEGAPPPFHSVDWTAMKVTAQPDTVVWPRPKHGVLALMSDGLVETDNGPSKPIADIARAVHGALKRRSYNLPFASEDVLRAHVQASVGSSRAKYDGDDLTLVLVDVGLNLTDATAVEAGDAAARAAALAAAANRPRSRKVVRGRRGKTGKRSRVTRIFLTSGVTAVAEGSGAASLQTAAAPAPTPSPA